METNGNSSPPLPLDPAPTPTASQVDRPDLEALSAAAKDYAGASRAEGTRKEYAKHWAGFSAWCAKQGLCALPAAPETVALYLSARANEGRRPATLGVSLSALAQAHEQAGHASPLAAALVKETWKGIRRRLGVAPNKKEPLSAAELRRMMEVLPAGLLGLRDRALLLLGFAGGFRRAELVALDVGDLTFVREGLEAIVRSSKTDQERKGHVKVVAFGSDPATCPVRAVKDWLELGGLDAGPVFRPISRHEKFGPRALTGDAVATIVKRSAKKAGLPVPELSGHSLRAGFVTAAAGNGADYPSIMAQTGHGSVNTVNGYNRRKKWEKPASAKLGL